MNVTTEIEADVVAREMLSEPEWAFDVLAYLANNERSIPRLAPGGCGSKFHDAVPGFLRRLADAIETDHGL